MRCGGFVSLVGAGPGDPELLTIKALRKIQDADVVVYDRLVSAEILNLIPDEVDLVFVGKAVRRHCVPQSQINQILVDQARAGFKVVRLKGGDPYFFGRGGEEAQTLLENGIPFDVVPGITAASGCATYCGFPLTFRGMARRVQFITGHLNGDEPLDLNWQSIADQESTLVVYMGLSNLPTIVDKLVASGISPTISSVAIQNGTTPQQRQVFAPLRELAAAIEKERLSSPVIVIIGEVVTLAGQLNIPASALVAQQRLPNAQ